jgi:peptidoglycan/xylan/chitin deacetylase (PgdA/CDA1 family)
MTSARWIPVVFVATLASLSFGCSAAGLEDDPSEPGDDDITAWNEAYEENASGKTDSAGCSGVIVPDRKGFAKRIALTFDDGPHLDNTPLVLEILADHGAVGTFFVNGKNVRTEAHRALLTRMAAEGHIIGNHTQNHANMKTVSSSTARSEIEATHQILEGLNLNPRFFRFPFGSSSCATAETVRGYGYAVTGWHIDSADWCFGSATGGVGYCSPSTFKYVPDGFRRDIAGYVLSQARSTGGGVLLFHDIHTYTVSHLDDIMTRLESDGFKFVPLSDTSAFPLLNGSAPQNSDTAWVGTPCVDSATCSYTVSGQAGSCATFTSSVDDATHGFCSLSCEGFCPDQAGKARTFCTSFDGVTGQCVSKAGAENHDCADIPGTVATTADRFLGSSTATASTATVCLPQ